MDTGAYQQEPCTHQTSAKQEDAFQWKELGYSNFPLQGIKKTGKFSEVTNYPESYAKNWCLLITKIPNVTTFRNQYPTNGESSDKKNLKGLGVRAVWFILLVLPIMLPYSLLHSRFCYRHATLLSLFNLLLFLLFSILTYCKSSKFPGELISFFQAHLMGGLIETGRLIWEGGLFN